MKIKYLAAAFGVLALFSTADFAHASSLTSTQISAIITLLQAFGIDNGIIASVEAELDGSATISSPSSSACSQFSYLTKGETDATTNGQVSELQAFLGISPTTGYYGAQTSIAYQNKCGNLGNASPTSVPGMSKYTDSDFGFSFWYPSSWTPKQVSVSNPNEYAEGTVLKAIRLTGPNSYKVTIEEYHSSGMTITIPSSNCPAGNDVNNCPTQKIYFDSMKGEWMIAFPDGDFNGNYGTVQPANVSQNTMGGLHLINGLARFNGVGVIPLSAQNFLVVSSTYDIVQDPLVKTIVVTNPTVAIPLSTAEQTATIEAEASAYGATSNSSQTPVAQNTTTPSSGMQVYTGNGFSIQYPSGVKVNTSQTPLQSLSISDGIQLAAIGPIDQSFAVNESDWGTNGVVTIDGSVTVGLSTNATDVANCMSNPNGAEEGATNASTENINGVSFLSYEVGQPALGQMSWDHIYATLRNGVCYAIDSHIDGVESGHMNASDGAANDAATQKLSNELDSIAKSFTFTGGTASATLPTCILSTDKTTYQEGDVITLTWQSQNAQSALWKSAVDSNTGEIISNVVPEGTLSISGTATTSANLTGSQMITLQVTGPGGLGQCTTNFTVSPSNAAPSMTVSVVRFNPSGQFNNNTYADVILSGTITNGALYHDEVNIVLEDPTYTGPFDYSSVYSSANK